MLTTTGHDATAHTQTAAPDQWRTFSGSWTASGQRQTLPTEGDRPAAIVGLSGAVVLSSGAGLSRAFRGEAIAFDEGARNGAGRAVWTDTRGDRVFSSLKGDAIATGRRVAGTITGGTGRYEGITGEWTLTWQFVVQTDDGEIQGRASDLSGRFRYGEAR